MLTKRIIPCLDCDLSVPEGRVVKGVKFKQIRYAGEPAKLAKKYYKDGADELIFLDITASHERRETMIHVIEKVAEEVFMPLTVGGGIRTISDIKKILRAGADKVSINTSAIKNPNLIKEASEKFGGQCIVVAIDAKRVKNDRNRNNKIIKKFKHITGKHCTTASIRKILMHNGYDFSEEMLFGIGSGLGFIYWKNKKIGFAIARDIFYHTPYDKKMQFPFVGGRAGKIVVFEENLCDVLSITMKVHKTASQKKAYAELKKLILQGDPVMIYTDIVYLSYFNIPETEGSHFGGHAVVVCGIDEKNNTVYISDLEEEIHEISLDDLKKARESKHAPFPAENKWLTFEFNNKLNIGNLSAEKIINSIKKTSDQMLNPPIKNFGINGIEKFSEKILDWKCEIKKECLGQACLNTHIYIKEGGTGGGLFRFMYAGFLKEAGELLNSRELLELKDEYEKIGEKWDEIALLFKEIYEKNDFADENFYKISKELKEVERLEKDAALGLKNFSNNYTGDLNCEFNILRCNENTEYEVYGTPDTQKDENTEYECSIYGGRKMTGVDAVKWAKKIEELGAGDIMLTSMDRDGTKEGFDLELTKAISEVVNIPVIASGGVGNLEHIHEAFTKGRADAALAASIFHFDEYPIPVVKKYLKEKGISVRI